MGTTSTSTTVSDAEILDAIRAALDYADGQHDGVDLTADRIRNGHVEATVWDTDDNGDAVEVAMVRITVERVIL